MSDPTACPRWQDLTSRELSSLPSETVAVMVVGAIEQHGTHLPLSTDLDIGEGLLEEALTHLPEPFPLVILPPMVVGASDEHLSFPGPSACHRNWPLPPWRPMATPWRGPAYSGWC